MAVGNVLLLFNIPLSSIDGDTLPVGPVVGIVISALVILAIVIVAVLAVAGFARWWKVEDSGALDLKTGVSVECTVLYVCCKNVFV